MRRSYLALVGSFLFFAFSGSAYADTRPVIVVPGIMGSKLCDSHDAVIWGDRASYTAARINALRLPPNVESRDKSIHSCGLIHDVNIIPLLWTSDVYDTLLDFLKSNEFSGRKIIEFDYDWRLSNFDNAVLLKQTVERAAGPGQVDVVAHSMGGIIARIYFQSLGGNEKINNLIMLGTPHRGSAEIFERLKDGFDNWPSVLSGGLNEIQKTILSFPSTYQLLPIYSECCAFKSHAGTRYVDILAPETWKSISIPDDYKVGEYSNTLITYLADADKLKKLLLSPITIDPNELPRIRYIANGFVDTWSRVFFDPNTGLVIDNTTEPGDGTVLLFSATDGLQAPFGISLRKHQEVFSGKEPELVMTVALSDRIWHAGKTGFNQTLRDAQGRSYTIHSALFKIAPSIAIAGQEITATLTLRGESDISNADLSKIAVKMVSPKSAPTFGQTAETQGATGQRTLSMKFTAPSDPGPYKFEIAVGELEPLCDYLDVLK
jgi:hypothetical protein